MCEVLSYLIRCYRKYLLYFQTETILAHETMLKLKDGIPIDTKMLPSKERKIYLTPLEDRIRDEKEKLLGYERPKVLEEPVRPLKRLAE